jgi:hypothetical protein
MKAVTRRRALGSQSRKVWSSLRDTMRPPAGPNATSVTAAVCPVIGPPMGRPESAFHTHSVVSLPPETMRCPLGLNTTLVTVPRCALITVPTCVRVSASHRCRTSIRGHLVRAGSRAAPVGSTSSQIGCTRFCGERPDGLGVSYRTLSRSVGCPVSSLMRSTSLSACSTVWPTSSAVAAMSRSGMDGPRCLPESASRS